MCKLLARIVIAISLCLIGSTNASTQTLSNWVNLVDYRLATPRTSTQYQDSVYIGYDGGRLYRFDKEFNEHSLVSDLSREYIVEVFKSHALLLAQALDGDLYYRNPQTSAWMRVAELDCPVFVGLDDKLYGIRQGNVFSFTFESGIWRQHQVGALEDGEKRVKTFALRADTVLVAFEGDTLLQVRTLAGSYLREIGLEARPTRLRVVEDGSFVVELDYRSQRLIGPGSLMSTPLEFVRRGNYALSLVDAQPVTMAGRRGVVGVHDVIGNNASDGVYVMFGRDSIERVKFSDTLDIAYSLYGYGDSSWILASNGRVARNSDAQGLTERYWFGDSIVKMSGGIAFPDGKTPAATGGLVYGNQQKPAILPRAESGEPILVFGVDTLSDYLASSYRRYESGREIAFSSKACYVRDVHSDWRVAFTSKAGIDWHEIDYLTDSIIVCRSDSWQIVVSTDQGTTWDSVVVKGFVFNMRRPRLAGRILYLLSTGTMWALDLNDLRDTVVPPSISIQPGAIQELAEASSTSISCLAGRSYSDPIFNPAVYTHFVYYVWDVSSGRVDTMALELETPITSSWLHFYIRSDTTFVWSALEKRLISMTRRGILSDTVLGFDNDVLFSFLSTNEACIDAQNRWWLFDNARNIAAVFDPTGNAPTTVQEYYTPLFVESLAPNPAAGTLSITVGRYTASAETGVRLYLTDMRGDIVCDYTGLVHGFGSSVYEQVVVVNVSDVPTGTYFVVIQSSQGIDVKKVAVLH